MSSRTPEIALPAEFSGTMDMKLREAIAIHADPEFASLVQNRVEISRNKVNLSPVLSLSDDLTNRDSAIVILPTLPYMHVNALKAQMTILQSGLREPRHIITFPHAAHIPQLMSRTNYTERVLDYLLEAGIKEIDLVALESSVRAGALMADVAGERNNIFVNTFTAFEPPNVVNREPDSLLDEIKKFPAVEAMKAVLDIHGLDDIRKLYPQTPKLFSRGGRAARNWANFDLWKISCDDNAQEILADLSQNNLAEDLGLLDCFCVKTIVRGRDSGVCPTFGSIDSKAVDHRFEIDNMGREVLSPIVVVRVLKRVLEEGRA
jgi:hypothetical protein